MQMATRTHQCLDQGRIAFGAAATINSPASTEQLVANTDLDFIVVDMQHTPVTAADAVHLLQAVQAADPNITPFVRLPNHDVYWIQQTLDAGYLGLVIPLCESADQARAMVEATYFPPRGSRSAAGAIRASLYDDYFDRINDQVILLPQIESAKGLEQVEAIVAVDGVSGVLIGPLDLSLSCGWGGQDLWSFDPFLAAVERIRSACQSQNKYMSTLIGAAEVSRAIQHGVQLMSVAAESVHISRSLTAQINELIQTMRDQ